MQKTFKKAVITAVACLALGSAGISYAEHDADNAPAKETAGEYASSSALTVKVKAKLMATDNVKSLPITVLSYKDVVILAGFVDDKAQIKQAVDAVKSVDGVTQVKQALVVKH